MIQRAGQMLSASAVGRLISGFGERETSLYRDPVVELDEMARQCQVTFRPLPAGYDNDAIRKLRDDLRDALEENGVRVVPWEEATGCFRQKGILPIINRPFYYTSQGTRSEINGVIDVERPKSLGRLVGIGVVESLYWLGSVLFSRGRDRSMASIARLSLWADDHAVRYLQDHMRTQIVTIVEVDERLVEADLPYSERIRLGLAALARSFSQIVVGSCGLKLSIVNLNLTDSTVDRTELGTFVRTCLIPKLFLPMVPLLPSQFEIGRYDPEACESVGKLAELSRGVRPLGLLPRGEAIHRLLRRKSHRDIAKVITDGRTGVSFGFIAHLEAPRYVGPREISESQWYGLAAAGGYPSDEVRRGKQGRLYARIQSKGGICYRQIPDLWLASSRSGCDKTQLDTEKDVIRIGYDGGLHVQLPCNARVEDDLNPSYDIRVMLALGLAAALYGPEMVEQGAALFHFHGYPHRDWFGDKEAFAGVDNPAVPCGTVEAGVFNFQTMARLADRNGDELLLACIIEPDHGTNILARDVEYLIKRLREGVDQGRLMLGGRNLSSLKGEQRETVRASVVPSPARVVHT